MCVWKIHTTMDLTRNTWIHHNLSGLATDSPLHSPSVGDFPIGSSLSFRCHCYTNCTSGWKATFRSFHELETHLKHHAMLAAKSCKRKLCGQPVKLSASARYGGKPQTRVKNNSNVATAVSDGTYHATSNGIFPYGFPRAFGSFEHTVKSEDKHG